MEKRKRIVRILRIIGPIIGLITIIVILPLDLIPPLIAPLPDTVQAQVDNAVNQGLDGIIVYVDQAGKEPVFYAAGWKNKLTQEPLAYNSGSILVEGNHGCSCCVGDCNGCAGWAICSVSESGINEI